jgi:alpha-ketoglutaric semialdehyde dehydrogenase
VLTQRIGSFIGGRWHTDGAAASDENPAHPGEFVAEVAQADAALASAACDAALAAAHDWRATPAPARGVILRHAAEALQRRAGTIAEQLTAEEGKTLAEAKGETARALAILTYFAGQTTEPDGETYPSHSAATSLLYASREPVGVVTAITPWNFPIAIPTWKIAPALAYGNTVVWKPAQIVPLTAKNLVECFVEAGLPDGVLNLVLGPSSQIGNIIVEHPGVDAITFTGSNAVGRALQQRAVARGKKVQLELGGKNPAIVLADADLRGAAENVARGAFLSTGQKCTATSRVIVAASIIDEFQERLAALAREWRVGEPMDDDTRIGPLASRDQFERVHQYLALAQREGHVLAGAGPDGRDGYYVRPMVVTNLPPTSRLLRDEIFGPVAAVIPATSFEHALALANDTPFGLSASVFTNDLHLALRFAREIRSGVVKINQESAGLEYHVPFGGVGQSSSGSREQGRAAREFFTQWKTVYVDAPGTPSAS